MRIIVLGAGLMGIGAAYYLARDGHEVTVIDRREEPARETSFANAGLLTPSHAHSWAAPTAPLILLKSLWRRDTALRYGLRLDPGLWRWSLSFLRHCAPSRNLANTLANLRLSLFSLEETRRLTAETGMEWDRTAKGALYLYEKPAHFRAAREHVKPLADAGIAFESLDEERLIALEPALAEARGRIAGALHTPQDESGDARKFTLALAALARRLGVTLRLGETILRLEREGDRITRVLTDAGEAIGDAYVLALGAYAPLLARPLGLRLPIYPVKGYSVTLPLTDPDGAPSRGGVHEEYLIAFSRLGDRLRITSTAHFAGYDISFKPRDFAHMLNVARSLFPRGGDYGKGEYWACLRPMTPDGPPILGASPLRNLWLNTGHGHLGWTMAAGSARLLADAMAGRKPALSVAPYVYGRH